MKKKNIKILAIETSCDETAAAAIAAPYEFTNKTKNEITNKTPIILSNIVSSQVDLHAKTGGVVPEVASRAHMEAIIPVVEEALDRANVELNNITQVAVTSGPGLIGSLLVGFNAAKTIAYAKKLPLIPINHIEGHIYSAFSREAQNPKSKCQIEFPVLALTVSGGHTSLTLVHDHGKYETIGETIDDAAGEAFDKVAKLLGLGYPGGPAVSKCAQRFRSVIARSETTKQSKTKDCHDPSGLAMTAIEFPRPLLNKPNFDFSFSGLKTAVLTKVIKRLKNRRTKVPTLRSGFRHSPQRIVGKLKNNEKEEICFAFEEAVVDVLVSKTLRAARKYKPRAVILAGGVAANSRLRQKLTEELKNLSTSLKAGLKTKEQKDCHSELVSESQRSRNDTDPSTSSGRRSRFGMTGDIDILMPPMELCGDNAAMIGLAAYYHIIKNDADNWRAAKVDSNAVL